MPAIEAPPFTTFDNQPQSKPYEKHIKDTSARQFRALLKRVERTNSATDRFCAAVCLHNGYGTKVDFFSAIDHYTECARAGMPEAFHNLASLSLEGHGLPRDSRFAVKLFESAAKRGVPESMRMLWVVFLTGECPPVAKNEKRGLKWLRKAAEAGDAYSMYELGLAYGDGKLGVPIDHKLAADLLARAYKSGLEFAVDAIARLMRQAFEQVQPA